MLTSQPEQPARARRGAALILGLFALLGGAAPGRAAADERCYVVIFGAQPTPKIIRDSHTWATFVRTVGEGPDPAGYQVFAHTISFVPASLRVRTLALDPEPGINLDLEGSLAYCRDRGAAVTAWGPFLIRPQVYQRSLEVYSLVGSGAVRYRAIDTLTNQFVADCIHAVTAVDPKFGRGHYPLIRTGKAASRYIAGQIATRTDPEILNPDQPWILAALGLDRHPVEVILPSQVHRRRGILAPRPD